MDRHLCHGQSGPTDTLVIDDKTYTLLDWAEQARLDACYNPINEFSWSLIALTYYFPDDHQWTTNDGSTWSWSACWKSKSLMT